MQRFKVLLIGFLATFLFCVSNAGADTIENFGDSNHYYPGWANNDTTHKYKNITDNNNDVIGEPDITGGSAVFTGNILKKITFNIATNSTGISPGDLLLDVNSDETWNYFVDLTTAGTWKTPGAKDALVPAGNYVLYAIDVALGSYSPSQTDYTLSGNDLTGGWSGYWMRDNHPVAISDLVSKRAIGSVYFSGWTSSPTLNNAYFQFDSSNVPGLTINGDSLTIGWAMNCANEVIYEKVNVPEPANMILLGTGLITLAGIGRKKLIKR